MGGEDHHFVLELRIASRHEPEDVGRLHAVDVVGELQGGGDSQRDGLEVAGFRLLDQLVEVLSGGLEKAASGVLGGPTRHLDARFAAGGKLELLAAPRGLHDLPGIAGGWRGVDDDGRGGSLPRRALVLVDPAAVKEPPVALEQLGIPIRIVVHHHQDLALEVHALEIVPLVLGRLDAVAHEHELGVLDAGGGFLNFAEDDVIVPPLELDRLVPGLEIPSLGSVRFDAHHFDRLLPRATGSAGLEAEQLEGGREIEAGRLVATAGDAAALQQIVGKETQGRLQSAAVNGLGRLGGARWDEKIRRGRLLGSFLGAGKHRGHRAEKEDAGEDVLQDGSFRILHER